MQANGPPVKVSITQQAGAEPLRLLERALHAAGFWNHVEQVRGTLGLVRGRFQIIIKPDLDFCSSTATGGTAPALVEHLIDLLHERGYRRIVVGDGRNEHDAWLQNREPLVVPELVGYRFATARGRAYEFVDLQSDIVEQRAPGSDACVPVSRHWAHSSYRINFAKNKTHEEYAFALCVHNLAGVAPARDAGGRPRHRLAAEDCLQILRMAPPHFNIIDAFVSCHGGAGNRAPSGNETHAFIASESALLADLAGAAKMGVDPYASPVNAVSLRHVGLPPRYEIDGDLSPYRLWRNVHPLVAHTARLRSRSEGLGRIAAAWFQTVDRELFPFRDFYSDRINSYVAPLMARIDENPRSFWAVVLLNYAIARIGSFIASRQTMFSKDRLRWRLAPLQFDPAAYKPADYETIPEHLSPFMRLLEGFPPNRNGLRWRHVDGCVVFSCSHVLPVDYERFVDAVDIACAIQYMNDYIGGSAVSIRRDRRQRVIHQAERNLYLQQPNWMVFFGGEVIDVEKLELIEYRKSRRTIYWRSVGTPNDSATHDDGSVSFLRNGAGRTKVTIFGRQKFSLPLPFRMVDFNMAPAMRDPIIESAYDRFFAGTIANLKAKYQGRAFRIGREATQADIEPMGDVLRYLATAAATLAELLRHRDDMAKFGEWLSALDPRQRRQPADREVDRQGFRHFRPAAGGLERPGPVEEHTRAAAMAALLDDAPEFVAGLAEAVRKDLERSASRKHEGASR